MLAFMMIDQLTNYHNPLVIPVLDILQQADVAISEYELIRHLDAEFAALPNIASTELGLFQKHFMVMNALYQLQQELVNDGYWLSISPLAIELIFIEKVSSESQQLIESDEKLSDYYLDWTHLENADEDSVAVLLNSFWQRYLAQDKCADAYRLLKIDPEADWTTVQAAYRRAASKAHPDKGGNSAEFMALREAYEILRQARGF